MRYLVGVATAALLLASGSSAMAAQASATVTANATVITPLTASATATLEFGKLVMNTTPGGAGTLTVAPATGNRSAAAGVDLVGGTGGQAAVVHVVGDIVNGAPNAYPVTIPATTTLSSGANTMAVSAINTDTAGLTTLVGTVDLKIGATLTAAAGQAPGAYTGTFNVTAAYN